MKVSHVLYKVNNLDDAVNKFRNMGFSVEYGSKNNPHNELIYFSEGQRLSLSSSCFSRIGVPEATTLPRNRCRSATGQRLFYKYGRNFMRIILFPFHLTYMFLSLFRDTVQRALRCSI